MPQPRKSDAAGRKQPTTIDGRILKQQKTAQKYIEEARRKKEEKRIFDEEITRVKQPKEKQQVVIQPEEIAEALPTPWKYLPHTLAMHLSGGKWRPYKFLVILSHILTTLVARGNARIVVSLPPRHGKSNFISEWFPTWYLANWPQDPVMLCTYEATFAASWGRKVRNHIKENQEVLQCYLSEDAKASDYWLTTMGGGMITAGAGGAITGKGFKLGIIDDPHKNWEEAMSPTMRGKIQDWYDSTFYTRAEEGASIIILQTRWHEEDLVGYCLAKHEGYVEIRIPALAEEENDFLGRRQGEALVPDRFDEKALASIQRNIGSQMWVSLYQQRPAAEEGNIFKRADLRYYKVVPQVMQIMQSWDTGFKTTKGSAYSVCQTWGVSPVGFILLDQFREMVEWPDLEKKVRQQYLKWRPAAVLIEDKASGQSLIQSVNRWTDIMIPVIPITPVLDKVLRARTVSPLTESHRVWLPDSTIAPWIDDFVDNLVTFPNIKYLDEIDAFSQMLSYWTNQAMTGSMQTSAPRIIRPTLEDFHIIKNYQRAWK